MFPVTILEGMHTSGHFIVGKIERDGFYTVFIVYGSFSKNGYQKTLAYQRKKYVDFVKFYSYAEMVVGSDDMLECVASL